MFCGRDADQDLHIGILHRLLHAAAKCFQLHTRFTDPSQRNAGRTSSAKSCILSLVWVRSSSTKVIAEKCVTPASMYCWTELLHQACIKKGSPPDRAVILFALSRSVESETHQRFPFSSKGHSSGSPNTCISLRCRISGSIFSLTMISVTCSVSGMRMMRASFRSMPVLILMAH